MMCTGVLALFSKVSKQVKTLLDSLGQCCSVISPGKVLGDIHTQIFGAAHPIHSSTADGQRGVLGMGSPKVSINLLSFPYCWDGQ